MRIERGFQRSAAGSVLYTAGGTRILCAVSIVPGVPPWLEGSGGGWATGEYAMLPASTRPRHNRENRRGPPPGRSVEIQRLVGRSIRSVLDLEALPGVTVHVDCDVIEADGGTRAAAITGAYVALADAIARARAAGLVTDDPIRDQVAAVSLGMVRGAALVDLTYEEDSAANFDCTLVCGQGGIVEIQGTAEGPPLPRGNLETLLDLALESVQSLFRLQQEALAS